MKKISVIIPCYNEEESIAQVVKAIPKEKFSKLGYEIETIVVDNNSTDNTGYVALKAGAKVFVEKKQGKGYAMIKGFYSIDPKSSYVVMLDGDNTYRSTEMLRLIEPLENDFCDVVIGSRMAGKMQGDAMTRFNRWGNWFFTFLTRTVYAGNVTDVCTGYFAWKKEVVEELRKHLESNGFTLEMEMIAKMSKLGYSIYSVPITYDNRAGHTNLKPIRDGYKIFKAWARNLWWKPR